MFMILEFNYENIYNFYKFAEIIEPINIFGEISPNGNPAHIINKVDKNLTIPTLKSKIDPLFPPAKKLFISMNPPPLKLIYF